MKPVDFAEQTIVYAKDQPEYEPLPAYRYQNDPNGIIVCCWQVSWKERLKLLWTGKLWHSIWTFRQSLQPQLLSVKKPEMPKHHQAGLGSKSVPATQPRRDYESEGSE